MGLLASLLSEIKKTSERADPERYWTKQRRIELAFWFVQQARGPQAEVRLMDIGLKEALVEVGVSWNDDNLGGDLAALARATKSRPARLERVDGYIGVYRQTQAAFAEYERRYGKLLALLRDQIRS